MTALSGWGVRIETIWLKGNDIQSDETLYAQRGTQKKVRNPTGPHPLALSIHGLEKAFRV
jgi:hypothetical protein